jgi:transcriptional regulator with XRE-family HTH domain
MSEAVGKVGDESCSVENHENTVSARLRIARAALKMTQKDFVEASGIPLPSLRDYERCKRTPGGDAIASMVRVGINANWLLVGEGSMLLTDTTPSVVVSAALDPERLRLTLQAVEESLAALGRVMVPDKKAELVVAIYDLFEGSSVNKEGVLKLVKLAT